MYFPSRRLRKYNWHRFMNESRNLSSTIDKFKEMLSNLLNSCMGEDGMEVDPTTTSIAESGCDICDDDRICSICLEEMKVNTSESAAVGGVTVASATEGQGEENTESILFRLECGHCYHQSCIQGLLMRAFARSMDICDHGDEPFVFANVDMSEY